jgi:glycerol-3-phosphate dehydrogenase subunit B
MSGNEPEKFELAVIGAGTAGIASSVFASYRGIKTFMAGRSSELGFASGCLDLLGCEPLSGRKNFSNPWEGIDILLNVNPGHPYSKLSKDSIMSAFNEFSGFMSCAGLPCVNQNRKNSFIITPAGTVKPSFCIPRSMYEGFCAVEEKKRILVVSIRGLKGFSSVQICSGLAELGIDCRPAEIDFPGNKKSELNCERMAWDIEMSGFFESFVEKIKGCVKNENAVGIPAVLGIYRSEELRIKMEQILNLPVFEIPTFSPSVPGLRMKEKFIEKLNEKGVKTEVNSRIEKIEKDKDNNFVLTLENNFQKQKISAENIILATGRFLGGGLNADKRKVFEPLMGLYVDQSESGYDWYDKDFFAGKGHAINRCGIPADRYFRPVDKYGIVRDENLYAAGSILAGQDWKREKSGSGIAIASSYAAVSALSRKLKNEKSNKFCSKNKENAA